MNEDLKIFIERLTELLDEKGMNRHQLTKDTGCDNSTVANWFSGKFFPRHTSLIVLADYFNCSIDFLLGLTDKIDFCLSKKPSNFANRFKVCILRDGLSEYRIAKLCDIQQATISKWLIHERMPNTETLIKLSRIFNCSIEFLLGRSEN